MYELYSQPTSTLASLAGQSLAWHQMIAGSTPTTVKIFITVFITFCSVFLL